MEGKKTENWQDVIKQASGIEAYINDTNNSQVGQIPQTRFLKRLKK